MVSGDSRMVSGEVASKLDSRGPFQADSYSDSECNLPKVEVAGSIPVSRSIGTDSRNGVQAGGRGHEPNFAIHQLSLDALEDASQQPGALPVMLLINCHGPGADYWELVLTLGG